MEGRRSGGAQRKRKSDRNTTTYESDLRRVTDADSMERGREGEGGPETGIPRNLGDGDGSRVRK